MVVGAHAVMVHGVPRFTADLDVVVHLGFDRSEGVRRLLDEAGCSDVEVRRDEFGERLACVTPEAVPLEIFFTPPNEVYDREFSRRVAISTRGRRLWFLSAEDLVLRKLVNARLRRGSDLDDAVSVAATQGDRLDVQYLRRYCGVYRSCEALEKVLARAKELQE